MKLDGVRPAELSFNGTLLVVIVVLIGTSAFYFTRESEKPREMTIRVSSASRLVSCTVFKLTARFVYSLVLKLDGN